MTLRYKKFEVRGTANTIGYDVGLTSTEEEPKKLKYIEIRVDAFHKNTIEGWLEREQFFEILDRTVEAVNGVTIADINTRNPIARLDIDVDIPIGQTFKVAIRCGAAITNIEGAYAYEIIK